MAEVLLLPRILSLTKRDVEKLDGAASVIRTRDLTLTKGALYRWSYSSTWRYLYITAYDRSRGAFFKRALLLPNKPRAMALKTTSPAIPVIEPLEFQYKLHQLFGAGAK